MSLPGPGLLERYRPASSPLHRLDARPKLIAALALIAAVAATPPGAWHVFAVLALVVALAAAAGRVSPAGLLKGVLLVLPFTLVAAPTVFTRAGQEMWQVQLFGWTLTATREGLAFFLSVMCKGVISVCAAYTLTATTRFDDIAAALRFLRVPYLLVSIVSSTYRYLFVLTDEAARLSRARLARSTRGDGRGGGSLMWRARVTGGMVGSLFLRTYERSERVYQAMLARGFDGELRVLPRPALDIRVWAATLAFVAALAGVETIAAIRW